VKKPFGAKATIRTVGYHSEACRCRHFEFALKRRFVNCADCGKLWDPFDALVSIARDWTYHAENVVSLKKEHMDLDAKVRALKEQRSSLRSQVRKRGAEPAG
jgi:hypothetical protein